MKPPHEYWLVWKDTGEKSHGSNEGDGHTCSTGTDRGAKRKALIRYDGLEDCIDDTRHKEKQSSNIMSYCHYCFLKPGRRKTHYLADITIFLFIFFTKNVLHVLRLTWNVATMHMPRQEIKPSTKATVLRRELTAFVASCSFSTYLYLANTVAVPGEK